MAITSILTALRANPSDQAGVRCGASLAIAHRAHLIGLHVIDIPIVGAYGGVEFPAELYEIQRQQYLDAADEVKLRFEETCTAYGIDGEWRCVEGSARRRIDEHSRCADLLCMGRPDWDDSQLGEFSLLEDLVLSAGRPVLVSPQNYGGGAVGKYVSVAWDGSREAARAITDALDVLRTAKNVSVVSVRSDVTDAALGALPGTDLSHYLARHGVRVEAQSVHCDSATVGDTLLDWVKGQGSDLLVMGAYGHSRFRETLLGGVTRAVLRNAAVPVLMAH